MAPKAKHIERKTLPTHITLTALLGRRRPMNSISAAPTRGNSGISQMCARKYSVGIMSFTSWEPNNSAHHSERSDESLRPCVQREIPRFARNNAAFLLKPSYRDALGFYYHFSKSISSPSKVSR